MGAGVVAGPLRLTTTMACTASSRVLLATCGPGFVVVARCLVGTSTLSIPSGVRRGNAEVVGVRGQGLGILWPFLGCPCRLWGRLKIPESTGNSTFLALLCGFILGLSVVLSAVQVRVSADPDGRRLLACRRFSVGADFWWSPCAQPLWSCSPPARMVVMVGRWLDSSSQCLARRWIHVLRQ